MILLETERLRLRRLDDGDFDALYTMFNDPEVMRYYPGLKSREKTRDWLDWVREQYACYGHGLWAAERKSDGEFVGQVGLVVQLVDAVDEVEIGYLLRREHWHRGYATEAAIACREHAFNVLGRERVISLIRPENAPSIAVAQRVGMHLWKMIDRRGTTHGVWRVDREFQRATQLR